MKRLMKVLVSAGASAALAVGAAGPALASDEVRVKMDPLNWNWTGTVYLYALEDTARGYIDTDVEYGSTSFSVQPGGGPQQVMNFELGSGGDFGEYEIAVVTRGVVFGDNVADPTSDAFITEEKRVDLKDLRLGGMSASDLTVDLGQYPPTPWEVDVDYSVTRSFDEAQDKTFYELKFFPTKDAPSGAALQNLHKVQSEGVSSEDCTVAVTAEPGDVVSGTDGDDVVCVTVADGKSDDPITIETGDGDDIVLIEGDSDATVVVDAGAGDDVVVSDTDATVDVTTGDGNDAVVGGEGTEATDETESDATIEFQQ